MPSIKTIVFDAFKVTETNVYFQKQNCGIVFSQGWVNSALFPLYFRCNIGKYV